jgi:hypothetical protein
MRVPALLVIVAGLAVSMPAAAQSTTGVSGIRAAVIDARAEGRLPIHRLTLYRSGVASVERRGEVQGSATIQMRFKTDQVNDILKSMVVLDLSGRGRIDTVGYASKEPLARRLASFGIDLSDEPPLGTILARLRGSGISFSTHEGDVEGTILGGETRLIPAGDAKTPVQVPYINVLTQKGVVAVNLHETRAVRLTDPALNEELNKALAALAEHRADRTKTVDIALSGDGTREIVVLYVQESPVWKTSYRLVLPEQDAKGQTKDTRLRLQGWAIVENTSDEDWKDVTLSLVSGRPVSFRMDLYEPLYMQRPELPVPTEPGVLARMYEGGMDTVWRDAENAPKMDMRAVVADVQSRAPGRSARSAAAAPEPGAPAEKALSGEMLGRYAAEAQARSVESGEVFQFEVDHPVTVERQRSAMIPIISTNIEGRRVSIFNPRDGGRHPMRGVEITNASDTPLLPGPISVFDGAAYAGDAQIGHVPKGDKRLLAYALDLDVSADQSASSANEVQRLRIVRGLLEMTTLQQQHTKYTFQSKDAARPRTILVEHPRNDAWEFTGANKPRELTSDSARFEVSIAPGAKQELLIAQQYIARQTYEIASFDMGTLLAYSKAGKVSGKVVDAVREAARRQDVIATLTRTIADLEKERREINDDQNRMRSNMGAIDRASELYSRYMKKLNDQESRLEAITNELNTTRQQLAAAQDDLAKYIAGLELVE